MEERSEYQVLAPDSVAWYIQAALVADRTGNVTARDVALSEAQRIAQERRLSERSYDCRTTGERLAVQEDRLQILSDTMRRIVAEIDQRLDALEAAATPAIANREWMTATEGVLNQIEARLVALEAAGPAVADGRWMAEIERRLDALEAAAAPAVANRAWMDEIERQLTEIFSRLSILERLNLASRVTYLENLAQGIVGPDAGL